MKVLPCLQWQNCKKVKTLDFVRSCLPSQRERIAQREFKLRRWACEPDCDHTKNSGVHPCSPRGSGGVQRSSDEARDESRARAMNNMTKIMSAVNSLSAETEKLTLDEARLAGKCERSRTTDSGVWCEELSRYCVTSPDDRIQPVPEPQAWRRLPAKRKAVNLPAVSSSEYNCSSREHCELQASEDGQSLLSVDKTIGKQVLSSEIFQMLRYFSLRWFCNHFCFSCAYISLHSALQVLPGVLQT